MREKQRWKDREEAWSQRVRKRESEREKEIERVREGEEERLR